jgi:outer membrane protein assembly factor BamB
LRTAHSVAGPLLLLCAGCSSPLERVFSTSGDAPSRSGLAVLDNGAVFGNEAGRVLRLGPQGEVLWTAEMAHEVRLPPAVVGRTVVATTLGTDAAGFDAGTGARRWRLELPRPAAALVGLGKTAYFLSDDGELLGLDAETGALQSRTALAAALGVHPGAAARLSLAVAPGERLLLAGPGAVLALGADTSRRWRATVQGALGLHVQDGLLFTVDQNGRVLGLDLETGEVRWQRALEAHATSPPAFALDRLWVGLENLTLVGFRPTNAADPLWSVQVPGPVVAPVVEFQGRLLVPTAARQGYLLALEVGAPGNPPSAQLDSPLRTAPVPRGDAFWVLAQDGRVVGFRLRSVAGSGR